MDMTIFKRLLDDMTLEEKLKIETQLAFIDLLTILGYRKDTSWTSEEEEKLFKLLDFADKHSKQLITVINKHNKQQQLKK